jgi:hypothetical protein
LLVRFVRTREQTQRSLLFERIQASARQRPVLRQGSHIFTIDQNHRAGFGLTTTTTTTHTHKAHPHIAFVNIPMHENETQHTEESKQKKNKKADLHMRRPRTTIASACKSQYTNSMIRKAKKTKI